MNPALFLLLATLAPPPACAVPDMPSDTTLVALYEGGQTFPAFMESVRRRRAGWTNNYGEAQVPQDLLARAQAVPGTWRLLVVALDGCSDSVSTLPFVARLVEGLPSVDLRLVDPRTGRGVMESHRTADGRAATPTLVLLDEDGAEAGCFIERPQALVAWLDENAGELGNQAFYEAKMNWYSEDAGISTLRQLVEVLEAAAQGSPVCH